jgi:ATP-binding cassette subfamily B multidrug efflux pump
MKALFHLNKYLFKYRWKLLLGLLFIVATNIFHVVTPLVVREATDTVAQIVALGKFSINGNLLFDITSFRSAIVYYSLALAGIYIGLFIVKGIFLFFTRMMIIVVSRHIEYDLKNEIFGQYQRLTPAFYKRNNTGDLMNRISEDVSKVRMYLGPAIMYTMNLFVLAILVLIAMFQINVELTLWTLLPLPIMSLSMYYVSSIMNKRAEVVQKQQSRLSTMVQESISGIRVLKAYNREKASYDEFVKECDQYKAKTMHQVKVESLFIPVIWFLIGLSTSLTIYIGGQMHIQYPVGHPSHITIGDITAFVFYINMLTWPFASLGWVTSLVQRAAASQKRINEFLGTTPDIINENHDALEVEGEIEFENVNFVYPGSGIEALRDVSFKVKKGQTLAIIGRTGSGKSTITNLICRQYDVTKGSINIDGADIKTVNLDALRSQTGYVPQEVFLFSDTISNNISFGLSAAESSLEKIEQAARDAAIYENISEFKEGFETILGERGVTLSGGQKQRVSIARALIRNPKILLFDDCLSAVDTETEEAILTSLRRIMKGRTSILISHRVSTVKHAEHILVLDEGLIIEDGNHESLMSKKGVYAELHQKQLLEDEKINH